ncbi:hypothetical protein GXW74_08235 [Roseomonas eburnea]|uniref:Lipoprotein n=1 Tax=Neoroseomonas eburnea TaxID=1346889 RepID=A0A9X9X9T6_9PROT|nr:hypothetical protein [Neoroseomonas eburnea]MBR0680472.1 hypothetical protein [Neoroseomonas eburnea]
MALSRRAALSATLAVAACGSAPEPAPARAAPPSYSHLTPLRLAVGRIDVISATDPAATRTMPPAPLVPSDVVLTMARDRLSAGGGSANARFRVQVATLTREPAAAGGMFTTATERLTCTMRCRLDVVGEDDSPAGFAEAEVRRVAVRPAGSPAERARAAEEIVRLAGNDLNVEFEYQLRRNLRALIQAPARPGEATPEPVEAAPLPRS